MNQMVTLALASNTAHGALEALCLFANKFPDEEWSAWVGGLAADAERLLDKIDATREKERADGAAPAEIDAASRGLKESAKPSRKLRDQLADTLGKYEMTRALEFDPVRCKVKETPKHPASAPTEQKVSFALCLAIRDGYWQFFRKCRDPKCGKYFYDHMERGRPAARYCCTRHREAHKKRIQRGTA